MFTEDEKNRLIEYIDFMNEFDDDPDFRGHALSAREKLVNLSPKKTTSNTAYTKCQELLKECYISMSMHGLNQELCDKIEGHFT